MLMSGVARSDASASLSLVLFMFKSSSSFVVFREDVFESKLRIGIALSHSSTVFISRSTRLSSPPYELP